MLFEIGSISKVFTGVLLADAVLEGKLTLDDTLTQRLPVKFGYAGAGAVTLKQLATHTSCLPRLPANVLNPEGDDPYAQYDRKAMFEYLASAKLQAQPPCEPAYSNLGVAILGVVLETILVDAQLSFHRNASGQIAGLTLHQNGQDVPARRDAAPPPHVEFPSPTALAEYAEEYDFGNFQPGATITVRATPEVLLARLTGQQELPVFSIGKDQFEYDVVVATLTFERDQAGKVIAVVLHQNGRDMRSPKR